MKILHAVEFYYPSVGGAQEVVKQLSEHLVMLGHDVTVATTKLPNRKAKIINGVKIKEFNVVGNQVRGYRGGDIDRYKQFLVKSKFDLIMNYAAQQWTTDLTFDVIDKIKAKKVMVPCGFSGIYDPAYKEYFKKLPDILRKYDATIYLSKDYRDINFARQNNLKNLVLIPNGADEREFKDISEKKKLEFRHKYGIDQDSTLILNVGNHTGLKGHQETIQAFKQARIKNSVLMFIGDINTHAGCYNSCKKEEWISSHISKYISRSNKQIKVISLSRKDTIKAFATCDLLLFLSNLECSPLVLFESAAAGKPFIASSCGNAKEISTWTKSGIIVKSNQNRQGYTEIDIRDSARTIEKLVNNPSLRLKMGHNGRVTWQKKYSWAKISRQYENLYNKILEKKNNEIYK